MIFLNWQPVQAAERVNQNKIDGDMLLEMSTPVTKAMHYGNKFHDAKIYYVEYLQQGKP